MNKFISLKTVVISGLILLVALVVLLVASQRSQDVRQKAAVPNGPAQYLLTPSSSSIPAGSPFTITLSVITQNIPVDGFQVVTKFAGTIPSDLAFDPVVPQGLKTIRNSLRDNGSEKVHELVLITGDPANPPFLSSSIVSLGRYVMTGASSGSLTLSFDLNLSKILQNGVAQDILRYPDSQTYTFIPEPTPTPTPIPQGFLGQYYANRDLAGTPTLTRIDAAINFDWGNTSPDPKIPNDKFSVRWTKTENTTSAGVYRFSMTTDDGGRVFVDGQRIINQWKNQSAKTKTADITLSAGPHTIIMEYYENKKKAVAKLSWTKR